MFIALLSYIKPFAEIERLTPQHREFLDKQYAAGHFICSGRRTSKTGGVIMASVKTQAELEAILQTDPFYTEQAARFEIIEFTATKWSKEFGAVMSRLEVADL